jgi:hypothetical protein
MLAINRKHSAFRERITLMTPTWAARQSFERIKLFFRITLKRSALRAATVRIPEPPSTGLFRFTAGLYPMK